MTYLLRAKHHFIEGVRIFSNIFGPTVHKKTTEVRPFLDGVSRLIAEIEGDMIEGREGDK
jgi:hypothetical protein